MDFGLSPEQAELERAVLEFARRELNDDVAGRDEAGVFSRAAWSKCAAFGLLGLPVPAEFGGQGQDLLTTTVAMEALGRGCRDNGLVFSLNAQMWAVEMPILAYGSEEQKRAWLPRLVSGEAIGAHAITEPGAGSDVFALASRAERVGEPGSAGAGYRLNGAKTFSTNAPVADLALAFAYLDRGGDKARALTAFLVPRDTPGVTFSKPIEKLGLRTSPMGEVVFEDCVVPEARGWRSSTRQWSGSAPASSPPISARWSACSRTASRTRAGGASSASRSPSSSRWPTASPT